MRHDRRPLIIENIIETCRRFFGSRSHRQTRVDSFWHRKKEIVFFISSNQSTLCTVSQSWVTHVARSKSLYRLVGCSSAGWFAPNAPNASSSTHNIVQSLVVRLSLLFNFHSFVLSIRSFTRPRWLVGLLHTAHFARALRCAHTLVPDLVGQWNIHVQLLKRPKSLYVDSICILQANWSCKISASRRLRWRRAIKIWRIFCRPSKQKWPSDRRRWMNWWMNTWVVKWMNDWISRSISINSRWKRFIKIWPIRHTVFAVDTDATDLRRWMRQSVIDRVN